MKKLLNNRISHLLFLSMMMIVTMLTSCNNNDDSNGAPVITEVRNYAAAPNDTLVNKLVPGQWVVLKGSNLKNALKIAFNGVATQFDAVLFTDTYAVVQLPYVIPFPLVPADKLNTIEFVTTEGSTIFNLSIVAGPPSLGGISNENPVENDSVHIYGTNLFQLSELNFGGAIITDYKTKSDGTVLSFKMPNSTTAGPLKMTTLSGEIITTFNVNDLTTGVLCNFDTIGSLAWGTATSNNDPAFPGNHGTYPILNNGILNGGTWDWWGWERSINVNSGSEWVSKADLALSINKFALKFELNVPGKWNGTSIFIVRDYNWDFVARFEPWKVSETKTTAVTTEGKWVTVTIPLTEFRTKKDGLDGTGNPAISLSELFGAKGTMINFFAVNPASTPTATGLRAAIDNIRVVKIN